MTPLVRSAALALAVVLAGCASSTSTTAGADDGRSSGPRFEGLGAHARRVSGVDAEAQRLFDQGVAFLSAFNHDEAVRSFQAAAARAPAAPMPWWGQALAHGPHINAPTMTAEQSQAAWAALQEAKRRTAGAPDVERALVDALAARYAAKPPADRRALDRAYADAMKRVQRKFEDDADVAAWTAEALMDLRPWDLWTDEGEPQPGTNEIVALLEHALTLDQEHPLALHLYVHALEASPRPAQAKGAADRLRDLAPGLGHLVHMPSHIDVRVGDWRAAVEANQRAIDADRRYRALSPVQRGYALYMAHNRHMLAYAAMMRGQSALAIQAMRTMVDDMPPAFVEENPAVVDGYLAMPLEVLVRFGRWDDVLAWPEPSTKHPFARSLRRAARGVALAAQGRTHEGRHEQEKFLEERAAIGRDAVFGNNAQLDLLQIASRMLEGELLAAEGKVDDAVAALTQAVALEDRLRYDEPPDWILPVRHALAAVLLEHARWDDAERVLRADLKKHPDNGWALQGLARALAGGGKVDEAKEAEARFTAAWRDADVEISTPCLCRILR